MNTTIAPGRIVLGTMDYGTLIDTKDAFVILDRFVEAGGVWLDTANCYSFWNDSSGVGGASERVLGEWFRLNPGGRESVRIATKVRHNPLIPHSWPESAEGLSRGAIMAGIDGSLERLGIDCVDMLWAHAEDRAVSLQETVEAFGELVSRGVAHRIGAANHAGWRVEQARSIAREQGLTPWSALQLRHSLVQPRPYGALPEAGHKLLTADDLDFARHEKLAVWCYTPLMQGGYTRPDKPFSEAYDHPGTARVLAVLDDVARDLDATRNQVVLAWMMRQGIDPIVGVSRVEQLDEAFGAEDIELSDDHMARFAQAR
ncbi:aldo/keto reductase [Acrocarpospora catenulata]|uniref:aldo/keto reductase n=1 Tax=Acrocarpospora catenulata TaxID=2836182 RepID=UPI001BDAEDD0|nr:aldo/keto reductase [Acrocarpospora catenulata]